MVRQHVTVISYRASLAGVTADDIQGFFDGWPTPPTPSAFLRVLSNSTHVVLAYDNRQVVGFINALSDGELAAYIPLLEVRASHRGRGIGSELVRRMVDILGEMYMVDLVCDDEVAPLYERLGMTRLAGMARRNRDAPVLNRSAV
jgi:ribosomal protein S18 acetylase RimI-like enzyme